MARRAQPGTPKGKSDEGDEHLSFETILEQLEGVVETLEAGDAPLEEALTTFERGVTLARQGSARLDEAERRIEVLLSDDDSPDGIRTRPLSDKERPDDE